MAPAPNTRQRPRAIPSHNKPMATTGRTIVGMAGRTAIAPGQSATLHVAVVPRIAVAPMQVSLSEKAGLTIAAGPARVQKLGNRDVIRRQYAVTRAAESAREIRVLVTMDAAEGTGFGFFTIPLEGSTPSRKLDSVKQQ